jgi:hypothetical protein
MSVPTGQAEWALYRSTTIYATRPTHAPPSGSIAPALPRFRFGMAGCSCISDGGGPFECCKIGTDRCRTCTGNEGCDLDRCCRNIGKPGPLPIPKRVQKFV